MSNELEALRKYQAKSPEEILNNLYHATKDKETLPTITLYSGSGAKFTGRLLKIEPDRQGGGNILLQALSLQGQFFWDVLFVQVHDVRAVQIHDSQSFSPVLSGGEIARDPGEIPPSSLELKRKIKSLEEELVKSGLSGFVFHIDWDGFATDEAVQAAILLNLQDLTESIVRVVKVNITNAVGLEAWKKVADGIGIIHTEGAGFMAEKSGQGISLRLNLKKALPSDLSNRLDTEFNRLL